MSTHTIILSPGGIVDGLKDVLTDWSAAGLISDFHWVTPDMVASDGIDALHISQGRITAVELSSLVGTRGVERVRLLSLLPALAEDDSHSDLSDEMRLAQALESGLDNAALTLARVIVAQSDAPTKVPQLALPGWHTVLLSPEDSSEPGAGRTQVQGLDDPAEIARPLAPALAAFAGLWRGVEESPLDARQPEPGRVLRLGRGFYRRLDGAAIEEALRQSVFSMHQGLPLPVVQGASSVYVEDSALATKRMSEQFWARHGDVLKGPREELPSQGPTQVGFGQALKYFFGFLWAALCNAPRSWAAGVVNAVKAKTAAGVHSLVFGNDPSAYQVVAGGVRSDGLPANWQEVDQALTSMGQVLDDGELDHYAHPDLQLFWNDYRAASLTLADGGDRVRGLGAVSIGSRRGVLRSPEQIVPGPRHRFTEVPPNLAPNVSRTVVQPYDVRGISDLNSSLQIAAQQPGLGMSATQAEERLNSWHAAYRNSFAHHVADGIVWGLANVQHEVRGLLSRLAQAAGADSEAEQVAAEQKKLARRMMWVSILALALIAVPIVLGVMQRIAVKMMVIALIVLSVAWLITLLVMFYKGQRRLFHLLTARRQLELEQEVLHHNLRFALADCKRLSRVYRDFLDWSVVIGSVLDQPFGAGSSEPAVRVYDVNDLPLSTRLGRAVVDDRQLMNVSAALRSIVYPTQWLDSCWEAWVTDARERVQPVGARIPLNGDPGAVFAYELNDLGAAWADLLSTAPADSSVSDRRWSEVLRYVDDRRPDLVNALLQRIVVTERSGESIVLAPDDFFGGLAQSETAGRQRLDSSLLSDEAKTSGDSSVDVSFRRDVHLGMSRIIVLAQLSRAVEEFHVSLLDDSTAGPVSWGDAADPFAMPDEQTDVRPEASPKARRRDQGPAPLPDVFGGEAF
ncbi:DUF2768 domain-containing protein [Pseudoclavibacter sp. CFCC 14310]|uniref:DUF2768 domain-containing protein n=1 Tax=Pseudoclavibacter sp. CFCC 14310 TaxID=2615180 RepID=UPI0013017926|nr:DUF2768 domain-containing protein [Pseudoclavibacter sp. CFCC 14310]KAB1644319.1 DUF2768 domain-containing protein [Pseudoclavibacter sp. CFCC 14310]